MIFKIDIGHYILFLVGILLCELERNIADNIIFVYKSLNSLISSPEHITQNIL